MGYASVQSLPAFLGKSAKNEFPFEQASTSGVSAQRDVSSPQWPLGTLPPDFRQERWLLLIKSHLLCPPVVSWGPSPSCCSASSRLCVSFQGLSNWESVLSTCTALGSPRPRTAMSCTRSQRWGTRWQVWKLDCVMVTSSLPFNSFFHLRFPIVAILIIILHRRLYSVLLLERLRPTWSSLVVTLALKKLQHGNNNSCIGPVDLLRGFYTFMKRVFCPQIISRCDVILIQEVRDSREKALPLLMNRVNRWLISNTGRQLSFFSLTASSPLFVPQLRPWPCVSVCGQRAVGPLGDLPRTIRLHIQVGGVR